MGVIYFEGRFLGEEEAVLPVSDRGFVCGDGAYATLQVRDGVPLFLETHVSQLREQCGQMGLSFEEIDCVDELVERNGAHEGIWRLKIFVTGGDGAEQRLPERRGRVLAAIKPFVPAGMKPLRMGIFSIPFWSCHAGYKSLAHLNRYYVMEEAYRSGWDDCVTVTEGGLLLEAAFGNLIWVHDLCVYTPDPSLPLYFGVTVRNVIQMAADFGFRVEYVKMGVDELPKDAVAFRTNTMHGVRPIEALGTHKFKLNDTLTTLFVNGYEELIKSYIMKSQEKKLIP